MSDLDAGRPAGSPSQSARAAAAQAQSARAAAHGAAQRIAPPIGWWGMVLFLCSEVTLFGTIIGSYFYLDFGSPRWPPAAIPAPEITRTSVATGVLVALTPLLVAAARAAGSGRRWRAVRLVSVVMVVQCLYLAAQVLLLRDDILKFSPQSSAYGSIYYTLLVAHHAHVLFGILLDAVILYKLVVGGLDRYWLIGVRGLALYWYVVNFLAVVVLLTILSPSL